jgi:hypothetical protein
MRSHSGMAVGDLDGDGDEGPPGRPAGPRGGVGAAGSISQRDLADELLKSVHGIFIAIFTSGGLIQVNADLVFRRVVPEVRSEPAPMVNRARTERGPKAATARSYDDEPNAPASAAGTDTR